MNKATLTLTIADIEALSTAAREELQQLFFGALEQGVSNALAGQPEPVETASEILEGPADLTVAICRRLIAHPIHDKSLAILRTIAQNETPRFRMADILATAPDAKEPNDLRGAWAGLSRRTRTILGNDEAEFVWWEGELIYDDAHKYVDRVGRVSVITHQSLRAALGIRS